MRLSEFTQDQKVLDGPAQRFMYHRHVHPQLAPTESLKFIHSF